MTRDRGVVLLALAALVCGCGAPPAGAVATPTAVETGAASTVAPATASPSRTASPTASPTTYIPPACAGKPIATPLPSSVVAATPSPVPDRPIAKDLQLRVFDTLARQIEAAYLYPDFNGVDWPGMVARYRAEIDGGLDTVRFYERMKAFVKDLGDEHSSFESPVQKAKSDASVSGNNPSFVGIGIFASPIAEKDLITVISVIPDSPAEHAGLLPHDAILTLDGRSLFEDGVFQQRFRGPPCSAVVIEARSPGGLVERKTIVRAAVPGAIPIDVRRVPTTDGSRIGYIAVPTFLDGTIDEQVKSALEGLAPLDGLILDERMNGGGSSAVVEPMLAYFTSGVMGSFISRTSSRALTIRAAPVGNSQTVPLVVLVSGQTVSFGEIFAGILQDRGRATIVGGTTKGNVETLHAVDLPDGSRAWIAQEGFKASRSGVNWERTGVVPEVKADAPWDEFLFERDPGVAAALKVLGRR